MKNYIEILKKCPLFDNIIENDLIENTIKNCGTYQILQID